MLREKLNDFKIILASGSPRRQQFFKELDLDFTIDVRKIEEIYPDGLQATEITEYLAQLKASAFTEIADKEVLITSDTIIWFENQALGKPKDYNDAFTMLSNLSAKKHQVITSVCFTGKGFQKTVSDITEVWFKPLSVEEIDYYIKTYSPYDKAGSYGIQEWIGYIGIDRIEGCYFNVMGLPIRLVYSTLSEISDKTFKSKN